MGNLIDEIKTIKDSAEKYFYECDMSNDPNNIKHKEYRYLINEYEKAVRWLRACNIEIDLNVK